MSDWRKEATPATEEEAKKALAGWRGESKTDEPPAAIPQSQSIPETALHSFGQAASFGLTDELRGVVAAIGEGHQMMREAVGLEEVGSTRGKLKRLLDAYAQERDSARKDIHKGEQDNPKTAMGAELAGALMAPGPKVGNAKGLARVGQGIKVGAGTGAAYSAGKSEADSLPEFAGDVATGAISGGAAGGALGGLSAMLRNAFGKTAESQAARAMGAEGGITDKMRRMGVGDEEARHALARTALDEGLIRGAPSKATVAERARDMVDKYTNAQQATLAEAGTKAPADPSMAAAYMRGRLLNLSPRQVRNLGPASKSVEDVEALAQGVNPGDPVAMNTLKGHLQSGVNYADTPNPKLANELDKQAIRGLRKYLEDYVASATGTEIGPINAKIGQGLKIEEIAKNAASRSAQRNAVGLGDKIVGANIMGGAMAGGAGQLEAALQAGGYGTLHNLSNQFGNALNAQALDSLSKGGGIAPAVRAMESLTPDEEKRRRFAELLSSLR